MKVFKRGGIRKSEWERERDRERYGGEVKEMRWIH